MLLERGQLVEAKQLVEDCITGESCLTEIPSVYVAMVTVPAFVPCLLAHNTGGPLDVKSRKRFHLILWEQAARAYEVCRAVLSLSCPLLPLI